MTNNELKQIQEDNFVKVWSKKTIRQIEKELLTWSKYMAKHSQSYAFHGADITHPSTLADGDKVALLREILEIKQSKIKV